MKKRIFGLPWMARSYRFPTGHLPPALCVGADVAYHPRREARGLMDKLTREERSKHMALIRSKGTKPELLVRRIARSCGYAFQSHLSDLPGKPDLAFPKCRKAIFVHGCFWHGHRCRAGRNRPKSNLAYWRSKLLRNRRRDVANCAALRRLGWEVLVLWECQLGRLKPLRSRIAGFLGG